MERRHVRDGFYLWKETSLIEEEHLHKWVEWENKTFRTLTRGCCTKKNLRNLLPQGTLKAETRYRMGKGWEETISVWRQLLEVKGPPFRENGECENLYRSDWAK